MAKTKKVSKSSNGKHMMSNGKMMGDKEMKKMMNKKMKKGY